MKHFKYIRKILIILEVMIAIALAIVLCFIPMDIFVKAGLLVGVAIFFLIFYLLDHLHNRYLDDMLEELSQNPESLEPYLNFLKDYDLPDVHSAMRMLYALSNGGYGNSEKQLSQILKRNQELLDKAEREQNQDSLAGLYALFLAPALTGAGKMMIDMTAFLVVFLASVHR